MHRLTALFLVFALAAPAAALADFVPADRQAPPPPAGKGYEGPGHGPGFHGPSRQHMAKTVAEALNSPDDTPCELTGHITEQLSKDKYLFRDQTGTIDAEIDHDKFRGRTVTPDTLVRIVGEVDRAFTHREVDVDHLEVLR